MNVVISVQSFDCLYVNGMDQVIYMGYIETPEAIEMVQYYFQVPSLTDAQTLILSDIIERGYTDLELPEPSARRFSLFTACHYFALFTLSRISINLS